MNVIYSAMQTHMLSYVQLLLNCAVIIVTAEPCSSADQLPVINICEKDTIFQDSSNTVLIQADYPQNCTCELSIMNQDHVVTVDIQKFGQKISSSPTHYGCGLILHFGDNIFWIANCVVNNIAISRSINKDEVMTIRSWTVNGNLRQNEGYCFEIQNIVNVTTGNKMKLTCGIDSSGSTTFNVTKSSSETTTKTNTLQPTTTWANSAKPTISTTVTAMTSSAKRDITTSEFTITNTDGTRSTIQGKTLRNKDKDSTSALAAGASVAGLVTIIVVIAVVCTYKRFRTVTLCENEDQSASNTTYDTLDISSSANGADYTSTSNDYSSLNVKDSNSMPIIGELNVRQNIPLASISTGYRDNTTTMENQRNLTKTSENRCEYANIVF